MYIKSENTYLFVLLFSYHMFSFGCIKPDEKGQISNLTFLGLEETFGLLQRLKAHTVSYSLTSLVKTQKMGLLFIPYKKIHKTKMRFLFSLLQIK